MLKTTRSHGKNPYTKKNEQKEGGKKNSANLPPGAQRMPNFPRGALEISKTIIDPTKYQ